MIPDTLRSRIVSMLDSNGHSPKEIEEFELYCDAELVDVAHANVIINNLHLMLKDPLQLSTLEKRDA